VAVVAATLVLTVTAFVAYLGSSTATASWFGGGIRHGDRHRDLVALTFDDGPNVQATPAIAAILDHHGTKGTFFVIGKALDAQPDVVQALYRDGQLVANHSYHHDQWRWLDPWYPELDRTQDAFRRHLGVCPAFFRPPHGQRTPFMRRVAGDRGVRLVMWDVSASDWTTTDARLVARRVLAAVRPGSIIDLHDGLDGNTTVDRSVVVRALPMILDGLRARGLRPVRLDQLIGGPAYRPCRRDPTADAR
jgi:peptidoglycan/xylan/chitin deacetylase (PgdA/CDA1 family)